MDFFDRSELVLRPLTSRSHDLTLKVIKPLEEASERAGEFDEVARLIAVAKVQRRSVILMMGAHVLRSGVQRYIIDLMRQGYISCLAMNGAGVIHDYEFAYIGATTESVARYIRDGQFGLWVETGRINDIIARGYKQGMGLGEAVGRAILEGDFPHKDISLLAEGYKLGLPVTIHVGIGADIIHEHPNCDGAATGGASYLDFLAFTKAMEKLDGGVVMNFGSAVTAPEVYLKALSMVRNVARQGGRRISHFTTLVCDLVRLPKDITKEPPKDDPNYYFRPLKTMLIRTVADGGQSFYVRGNHAETIPSLWTAIKLREEQQ